MDYTDAKVNSTDLLTLQSDLVQLSSQIHEAYDLMNSDVSSLGEYWRDQKFDEFLSGYKPYMDQMEEISERYREWATKDLQVTIDHVIATEGVSVTRDGQGSGNTSAGNGQVTPPVNPFLAASKKLKDRMAESSNKEFNPAAEKYLDEKTHKKGMDANEREYPHQGIINELEKKAREVENAKKNNMFAFLMQNNRSR